MSPRPLAAVLLAAMLTACAAPREVPAPTATPPALPATPTPAPTPTPDPADTGDPVVDLTALSQTMAFAELAAMTRAPEEYLGRTVRIEGRLAVYPANPALDMDYFYTVVMEDATACCQQGLEFVWEGDLPGEGTDLVVTGRYETYDCGGLPSYHLVAETVEMPG